MLELLIFLIKLPFILIGVVLSLVVGAVGALLSVVGSIVSGLWTALVTVAVVLFILWLVVKVLKSDRVTAAAQ
jgi:hypothetical protein